MPAFEPIELDVFPHVDSYSEEPAYGGSPGRNERYQDFMRAVRAPVAAPAVPSDVIPLPESPRSPSKGKLRTVWKAIIVSLFTLAIAGAGAFALWLLVYHCSLAPDIALEEFTIRDMAVFYNATTNSTPWQLTTDMNLTLLTLNPNTVVGCSIRLRRMDVSVYYKGFLILASEIPAAQFSLKQKKKRAVLAELEEERFQMADELGSTLEKELRSDNLTLGLEIYTRYELQRFSSKKNSTLTACQLIATTPLRSISRPGTLLSKACDTRRI